MTERIWVDPEYVQLFPRRRLIEDMQAMEGEVFRSGAGRVTLRFEKGGSNFFLKRHSGVGWREIFKDLFQLRLPVLGAEDEWRALERLQILNIATLNPIAFAQWGRNPAHRKSFLVTEELRKTISLEDVVVSWHENPNYLSVKRESIEAAAIVAQRMHRNGLNHRDFYICHLHIRKRWLESQVGKPEIFVIDLHRAQIRDAVPRRWLVKDVGSLLFSVMEAGLTRNDYFRFIRTYTGRPLRESLQEDAAFWREVQQRAEQLYETRPGQKTTEEMA